MPGHENDMHPLCSHSLVRTGHVAPVKYKEPGELEPGVLSRVYYTLVQTLPLVPEAVLSGPPYLRISFLKAVFSA